MHAQAAIEYAQMALNTNACTAGTDAIQDASTCEHAASTFGYSWGGVGSWPIRPKGCLKGSSLVFFNTHSIGSVHASQYPICQKAI